jgi:large subunit ribosomal protein L21
VYAVVESGGKQYRAAPGELVDVDRLAAEVGQQVTLDRVLLVANNTGVSIGQPLVPGAMVTATVVAQGRLRKITWFHYRAKKRERKKGGHRQHYTRLRIEQVQA